MLKQRLQQQEGTIKELQAQDQLMVRQQAEIATNGARAAAEQVLGTTWEGKTFFEHIHGMITDVAGEVMKEKVGEQLASAMGPVNARLAEDRQQMQEATSALAAEKKTRDKLNSKMEKAMAENAKALEKVVATSNTHNEYLEHLQRESQEERRREANRNAQAAEMMTAMARMQKMIEEQAQASAKSREMYEAFVADTAPKEELVDAESGDQMEVEQMSEGVDQEAAPTEAGKAADPKKDVKPRQNRGGARAASTVTEEIPMEEDEEQPFSSTPNEEGLDQCGLVMRGETQWGTAAQSDREGMEEDDRSPAHDEEGQPRSRWADGVEGDIGPWNDLDGREGVETTEHRRQGGAPRTQ